MKNTKVTDGNGKRWVLVAAAGYLPMGRMRWRRFWRLKHRFRIRFRDRVCRPVVHTGERGME